MSTGARRACGLLVALLAVASAACDPEWRPAAVPPPGRLLATGELGLVRLEWTPSTAKDLAGYHVYRRAGDGPWLRLTDAPLGEPAYQDAVETPALDGVELRYRVTAVAWDESAPTREVATMHGSRLPPLATAGFEVTPAGGPWVAEGRVVVDGGDLRVLPGATLHVLPGAVIDLERFVAGVSGTLRVEGTLRAEGRPDAPITFTAHAPAGALADGEGLAVTFDGAVGWNPADGSGSLVHHARFENLADGNANGGFFFVRSSPRLSEVRASSNVASGGSYLQLFPGGAPIIDHCHFERLAVLVSADLSGTPFRLEASTFHGGYYSFWVANVTAPALAPGQVSGNVFDGARQAYLWSVAGDGAVPLGGNHWAGGAGAPPRPAVLSGESTASFSFDVLLEGPPAGAGPGWGP